MQSLKIMITDDHEIFRKGLRAFLEPRRGWEICGEAANGKETIAWVPRLKPDILLLDVELPDTTGIKIAQELRSLSPATSIIILTVLEAPTLLADAFAAGAQGVVYKSDAAKDLVKAIESVSQRKKFVSPRVTEIIMQSHTTTTPAPLSGGMEALTDREKEVFKLIAQGSSTKEVAADLNISQRTASIHRQKIMEKLGFQTLSQLIFFAVRNHIVELSLVLSMVLPSTVN